MLASKAVAIAGVGSLQQLQLLGTPRSALPLSASAPPRPSLRGRALACPVRACTLAELGRYVSEAAARVFHPNRSDIQVPWAGTPVPWPRTPFAGKEAHGGPALQQSSPASMGIRCQMLSQ